MAERRGILARLAWIGVALDFISRVGTAKFVAGAVVGAIVAVVEWAKHRPIDVILLSTLAAMTGAIWLLNGLWYRTERTRMSKMFQGGEVKLLGPQSSPTQASQEGSTPPLSSAPLLGAPSNRPQASAEELRAAYIENRSFRITDLLRNGMFGIRGRTLVNCDILGPAILYTLNCTLSGLTFWGMPSFQDVPHPIDGVIWEVAEGSVKTGPMSVENCIMRDCVLSGIGLAMTPGD